MRSGEATESRTPPERAALSRQNDRCWPPRQSALMQLASPTLPNLAAILVGNERDASLLAFHMPVIGRRLMALSVLGIGGREVTMKSISYRVSLIRVTVT